MNKYINERLRGYFPITETQKRMLKDVYMRGTTHANMAVSQLTSSTRLEDDDVIYRTVKKL